LSTRVDDTRLGRLPGRIVHVHIPKTAGTALSEAFRQAYGDRLRVYPARYEWEYKQTDYTEFDFYGGHVGFKVASQIGGDLITVLRDPVDRFLSGYFFLRQRYLSGEAVNAKTLLAARYDLDQFAQIRDEPFLLQDMYNRMTWQIAYSHDLNLRQELIEAGVGDDGVVCMALSNLRKFAIVGIQTDMAALAEAIRQRYHVTLCSIGRVNVTHGRLARTDIAPRTLERIKWWVNLDEELYSTWISAPEPAPAHDSPAIKVTD
jgi:hypothetical protein